MLVKHFFLTCKRLKSEAMGSIPKSANCPENGIHRRQALSPYGDATRTTGGFGVKTKWGWGETPLTPIGDASRTGSPVPWAWETRLQGWIHRNALPRLYKRSSTYVDFVYSPCLADFVCVGVISIASVFFSNWDAPTKTQLRGIESLNLLVRPGGESSVHEAAFPHPSDRLVNPKGHWSLV